MYEREGILASERKLIHFEASLCSIGHHTGWDTPFFLPEVILKAMETQALLAAVSLPRFRLRWVKEAARRDHIKSLLTAECHCLTTEACRPNAGRPSTCCCRLQRGRFSFDGLPNVTADVPTSVKTEINSY